MKLRLGALQMLGRALMLPIAVLPIAGLLLRLGQPDLLDWPAMAAAGDAIFSNLGLLFAVGVGVGLARENHGAAGLAAIVCYLVATRGVEVIMQVPPTVTAGLEGAARELALSAFKARELAKLSVPMGLLSGITAGLVYNRYSNLQLPSYLSFFGGRRFIAIATGIAGLGLAAAFGYAWPAIEHAMDSASAAILRAGPLGLFLYGALNRVLIVTGLHHILNNFAWFILGDYHGATGDLKRFFAGDPSAGAFMSGFFPVMMFGLPGACLAMYHCAHDARRRVAAGLLLSIALTSFLTGVTEPVEFSFMFLAPALYALHALATGLAMVLMHALGVRLGFSFSAGLFDYVLNFRHAQRPLLLLPVGLAYFALYYAMFRYAIRRFCLPTPGREPDDALPAGTVAPLAVVPAGVGAAPAARGADWLRALGGAANLAILDACTTRLRLRLADPRAVDEAAMKALGARGFVRPGPAELQVVIGPEADQVAGEIRAAMQLQPAAPASQRLPALEPLLAALGGAGNLRAVDAAAGRLLLELADAARADEAALVALGARGLARLGNARAQLLLPAATEEYARRLRAAAGAGRPAR